MNSKSQKMISDYANNNVNYLHNGYLQSISQLSFTIYGKCHFLIPFTAFTSANRFNRYSIFGLTKRRAHIFLRMRNRNTITKSLRKYLRLEGI